MSSSISAAVRTRSAWIRSGRSSCWRRSGVFYRGDESRERLQRIYGTAFASQAALDGYLADVELRRARDHRRLGPELDLFSFTPHAPGSPFFHPRGTVIYNLLVDYVQGLNQRDGFEEVRTPQILDLDLWRRSGHWDNYRQSMFFTEVDERQYAVKPMNCPTHCLIYKTGLRSYRDLPIRYADFGRLHRYERSSVITGLTRVRTFCQDDAHTFCTEEQIEEEVVRPVSTILEIYRTFGFDDILIEVSTRPEKSSGSAELWRRAEDSLMGALRSRDLEFEINEGDGAFYGPEDRLPGPRRTGDGAGSWGRCSWTTRCRSVSTWSTPPATAEPGAPSCCTGR